MNEKFDKWTILDTIKNMGRYTHQITFKRGMLMICYTRPTKNAVEESVNLQNQEASNAGYPFEVFTDYSIPHFSDFGYYSTIDDAIAACENIGMKLKKLFE